MTDFKQSLGFEFNNVKENVGKNTTVLTHVQTQLDDHQKSIVGIKTDVITCKNVLSNIKNEVNLGTTEVSELKLTQSTIHDKVENLEVELTELRQLTEGMELEVIRQKKNHNKLNLTMSTQVSEIENNLAQHIETVKVNMEEEVSGTKQNQKLIENKLANFTEEICHQNSNMNVKIQDLQKEFEQLKTLTEKAYANSVPSSHFLPVPESNSNSNSSSNLSSSNLSFVSRYDTGASNLNAQTNFNSCDPDANPPQIVNSFYMYGDTTKSVILDGIREDQNESLRDIARDCINDIGIPITQADIENVFRIGKPDNSRSRPRPVKLVLGDQTVRDQIFHFKARLRFSELFKDIRINKEEPKDVRIRIAKLRQAGQSARTQGHKVETRP